MRNAAMWNSVAKHRNSKPSNHTKLSLNAFTSGLENCDEKYTHGFFEGKSINLARKVAEAATRDGG